MDIKISNQAQPPVNLSTNTPVPDLPVPFKPGQLLTAIVESIRPGILPADNLAGSQRPTTPLPGKPAQSPFEVLLNVAGKKLPAQSNQPFQAGQLLKIQVLPGPVLKVLEVIQTPKTAEAAGVAATNTSTSGTIQLKGIDIRDPVFRSLIQQGFRRTLPLQQSQTLALNNLAPFTKIINHTGPAQATTRIAEKANTLLQLLPTPQQLQTPSALKQAIRNSGNFLENKLANLLIQVLRAAPAEAAVKTKPQVTAGNAPPAETGLRAILHQNPKLANEARQLASFDVKTQLLQLVREIAPLLPQAGHRTAAQPAPQNAATAQLIANIIQAGSPNQPGGTTNTQTATPTPPASGAAAYSLQASAATASITPPINLLDGSIALELQTLIGALAGKRSQTSASGRAASETLDLATSTILRQLAASLSRIQHNQLTSLAAQQGGGESPVINSWNVEIPVYSQGQFRPIQIQIDEEKTANQEAADAKGRLWKITLGFDFADLGEFYATLRIVNSSVSTTFWSEQPRTLSRIREELTTLETGLQKLGLEVNRIDCRRGTPPLKQTRLDQQLVDIKT